MPRLHSRLITKIISYDNDKRYVTSSDDKSIIVHNSLDNTVIRTLIDLKVYLRDIFLLSDGRLASSFEDKTIKIWSLGNGNCEQILIGHSSLVYCLLELLNSILLSDSKDSIIGIWDISKKIRRNYNFIIKLKMINNHKYALQC